MPTANRPAPRSPLATRRPWDLVADAYAAELVPQFTPYAEAALALARPAAAARVADVACGPGTLALAAASRGLEVDALDVAPAMIAQLEALARDRGLARIRPVVGDGQALPWASAHFDAAFSLFGALYFADRAAGLAELFRVLTPGGRLVVSSWPPATEAPALASALDALAEAEPNLAGPPRTPWSTPAELAADLGAAGFIEVRVERVEPRTEFASPGAFVAHLERTSAPLRLAQLAVGDERWPQLAEAMRRGLTARFGGGPLDVVLPALLAVGLKPTDAAAPALTNA